MTRTTVKRESIVVDLYGQDMTCSSLKLSVLFTSLLTCAGSYPRIGDPLPGLVHRRRDGLVARVDVGDTHAAGSWLEVRQEILRSWTRHNRLLTALTLSQY